MLPHEKTLRPAWMIRIGLFLYDHLRAQASPAFAPGRSRPAAAERRPEGRRSASNTRLLGQRCASGGAQCNGCPRTRGATILTRAACVAAKRDAGGWLAEIREANGATRQVRSQGPGECDRPLGGASSRTAPDCDVGMQLRLVKGSHIIVPKLFAGSHAFILQNYDRRIVFAIPYEQDFTLVGTTDIPTTATRPRWRSRPTRPLPVRCRQSAFARSITAKDVVWTYAGVRPLFDEDGSANASAVSRDYVLELDTGRQGGAGEAPLLNVFGGKITTYRRLSEHALQKLKPFSRRWHTDWTAGSTLPAATSPMRILIAMPPRPRDASTGCRRHG